MMTKAMKLTTGILAVGLMAGVAWAQNTDAIDNARSIAKSLQQKQANDTNAALDAAGVGNPSKPQPGAPAPAVKPAAIPGAKPAAAAAPPAASAASQLERVNVAQASDSVQVEIVTSQAVTPKVSKLSSPARVLIELPGTTDASPKNHIAFGNAGVKGVRVGTDGKTPPTTSVVVDLDKACTYELTPESADKFLLTLHTGAQAAAANTAPPAAAKPAATASAQAKPAAVKSGASTKPVASLKPAIVATASATAAPATKPSKDAKAAPANNGGAKTELAKNVPAKSVPAKTAPAKTEPAKTEAAKTASADAAKSAGPFAPKADEKKADDKNAEPKPEDKKWAMNGKRDPFFSPVVQQASGSGCSTGKKCLEIGNINLRGVVKSDTGFIAVVTNSLNKAYFLRENDPVFNGYVLKITGDSVTFSETVEDKLGKPFTREVVKRIFTPAV
jgi:hypothetical protein